MKSSWYKFTYMRVPNTCTAQYNLYNDPDYCEDFIVVVNKSLILNRQ